MLNVFTSSGSRDCGGVSRREAISIGSLGLAGGSLGLADLLRAQAAAPTAFRDKSIVLLFLTGGPSQVETFDPKMTAPAEIRSVTGELATSLPGVPFGGQTEGFLTTTFGGTENEGSRWICCVGFLCCINCVFL